MSIRALSTVISFAPVTWNSGKRLVAVVLADFVNDDSKECWPTIRTVCKRTGLSDATVRSYIRELEYDGILERKATYDETGYQRSNVYVWKWWIGLVDNSD